MSDQDSFGERLANRIGINRAVLALSVGRLGDAVGNSLLFIVVPLFVARLPAPAVPFPETVRAGIVISLFGLVASFGQPFAGALIDRVNRRKPFVVGGLLILCAATAAFALAGDMSKSGGEGRQMSIVTMGFGLGAALGTLFAGLLAVVSLQLPFYVAGGASLLIAGLVYHYVYETVHTGEQESETKEASQAKDREAEREIRIMRQGAEKGLITVKSAHSVHATVNRLGPMLEQGGMKVFDRIDHADGAQAAGMTLRPTTLFIFGNPKGGTPWIQCSQSTGIDLPLKMLVWEDEQGDVWITYNDPAYIAARHDISDCGDIVAKTQDALQGFARQAAQPET
jgi:uncharacterized protein (DUF302 family)